MEIGAAPSPIDRALALAVDVHTGVLDKAGEPYILHVLRVMARMSSEDERVVAILHDVVEDSDRTIDDLHRLGFSPAVVAAVQQLTKPPGADYQRYVAGVRGNPLARAVKLADLEDNMDVRRIADPTDKDLERLRKYRVAWAMLRGE